MRLIDADLFMENARKDLNCDERCCECEYSDGLCSIYKMALTQQTAFDVEDVITQLENEALTAKKDLTRVYSFQRAIEIVKSALVSRNDE